MWKLVTGITLLSALGWLTNTHAPDSLWLVILFFLILGGSVYFLTASVFKQNKHAALLTLGIIIFLLLRLFNLRDWYYPVLLVPVLISLDVLFR